MKTNAQRLAVLLGSIVLATGALHAQPQPEGPAPARNRARAAEGGQRDAGPAGRDREATTPKIQHLRQAARHLEAAGFHEQAQRVRKVVSEMTKAQESGVDRVSGPADGPPPAVREIRRDVDDLRREIGELRKQVRMLTAKVDRQGKGPDKHKKKDRAAKREKMGVQPDN